MKYWKEILIVLLILVIVATYILHTETSNSAELKVKGLKADARESAKRSDSLEALQSIQKERWHKDSAVMAISNQKLIKYNARLQLKVSETRKVKEVQEAIDSIPQVAEAFNADDSLAYGLKKQVDTLTNQLTRQADSFQARLNLSQEQKEELKKQIGTKDAIIEEQDKLLKKGKLKDKLEILGIAVAAVIGFLVGN